MNWKHPFYIFSWQNCDLFVAFLGFFSIFFISANWYLLSKILCWKNSDSVDLKSFSWKPFLYTKKILSLSENKRITCWLFLSFLNKLIAQGLLHPCFTNMPLPPHSLYTFAFYPRMQDASTESPQLSNNANIEATCWGCGRGEMHIVFSVLICMLKSRRALP